MFARKQTVIQACSTEEESQTRLDLPTSAPSPGEKLIADQPKPSNKANSPRASSPRRSTSPFRTNPRSPYKCNKCGQPKKGHICLAVKHTATSTPTTFSAFNSSGAFKTDPEPPEAPEPETQPTPTKRKGRKRGKRGRKNQKEEEEIVEEPVQPTTPAPKPLDSFESMMNMDQGLSWRFSGQISTAEQVEPRNVPLPSINVGYSGLSSSGTYQSSQSTIDSVLFAMGWFDMVINAIDTLSAHLKYHRKSNWTRLDDLISHLGEEREYLECMREEFHVEASIPADDLSLLGKRSESIVRDFANGTLPGFTAEDISSEPAFKRTKDNFN